MTNYPEPVLHHIPGRTSNCTTCGGFFVLLDLHEITGQCPKCFDELNTKGDSDLAKLDFPGEFANCESCGVYGMSPSIAKDHTCEPESQADNDYRDLSDIPGGRHGIRTSAYYREKFKEESFPNIHPAFVHMLSEAIKHGMPKAYTNDLVIDLGVINTLSTPKPFIWMLRECGTHHFLNVPHGLHTLFDHEERHFYVWDGHTLTHCFNSHQCAALFHDICKRSL